MKKYVYITMLLVCGALSLFAQNSESPVTVEFGDGYLGKPYHISANAPALTRSWKLSVAEYNSNIIFETSGQVWPKEGYIWNLKDTVDLYSAIYYNVFLTFFDVNRSIIRTEVKQIFTPIMMNKNISPLIFFEGNSVKYSEYLYDGKGADVVLDFIAEQANTTFKDARILVRGHAAFANEKNMTRREEQLDLLDLSRNRAILILNELADRGVDVTRMGYEALGGSEEITQVVEQRWKNRRVVVVFVQKNISKYPDSKDIDGGDASNNTSKDTSNNTGDTTNESTSNQEIPPNKIVTPRSPPKIIIENTEQVEPWPDLAIMGDGQLSINQLVAFMLYNAPSLDTKYVRRIITYYMRESKRESVNHDIAIAQMALETSFLQFGGQVRKEQYNFAGIGTVDDNNVGNWFTTEILGVRAHVQHLKGYASERLLNGELVDPRYSLLERYGLLGSAPVVSALAGRWAADPDYGVKILRILRRMYNFTNAWMETYGPVNQ